MIPVGPAEMVGRLRDGFHVFCTRMDALDRFGDTREDFLKSFWCLLLIYPLVFAALYRLNTYGSDYPGFEFFIAETTDYLIKLVYWPLIMANLSVLLGRPERWIRYVVAANWVVLTPMAIQIVLLLTIDFESGSGGARILFLMIQGWSLFIGGMVLRHLFKTSLPVTLLLVLGDLAIGRVLGWIKTYVLLQSL